MKRTEEVWFTADDGARFQDEAACVKRDALIAEVAAIMAPLGDTPKDDGCLFANGHGFIPHNPHAIRKARVTLATTTLREHPWIDPRGTPLDQIHPSWFWRMLDGASGPLERAWSRLYCVDDRGREWGQPYYALNPDKGDQVEYATSRGAGGGT